MSWGRAERDSPSRLLAGLHGGLRLRAHEIMTRTKPQNQLLDRLSQAGTLSFKNHS